MWSAVNFMTRPVVTVRRDTPLTEAGAVLAGYGYAALPVVDADGLLLGVLTAGDVLRGNHRGLATAGDAMACPALVAEMFADVHVVGQLLLGQGIRSLPVVDDEGRVIGIISRGDLLRLDLTSDDAIAVGVQKLLDDYTGKRRWIAQVRGGEVTLAGRFDDDPERRIAMSLARTVPGVTAVHIAPVRLSSVANHRATS
ncbi:MAG: CBS domain-containing protein [Actinomycetota bacterium]|nr:CBS domain-containing protein [Actinomycetota bacterium]